jgi:phage baseplate assembly protein W
MPTFIGYNTINQYKKFTLTDRDLIQRDLLNALTIRRGEMPGRPDVGSGIYDLMFEPQAYETQRAIELEVQRIIGLDPRIRADSINSYPQENGILLEILISYVPDANSEMLRVFFDTQKATISYI